MAAVDERIVEAGSVPSATAQTQVEQANQFIAEAMAVNLDEAVAEPVAVTFVEWEQRPLLDAEGAPRKDADGRPLVRRVRMPRQALIETYVPMRIFNKMMAYRTSILKAQAAQGGDASEGQAAQLDMMVDMTLAVWQLTEPDMTRERYVEGLDFRKIGALFARFFGDQIRQQANKA